jgi:hypothetical protein
MSVRRLSRVSYPVNTQAGLWVRLALFLCFLAVSLFAEPFAAAQGYHDCIGEGCPLCLLVQVNENFSRQLKSAVVYPASFSGLFFTSVLLLSRVVFPSIPADPVRSKIKMNL